MQAQPVNTFCQYYISAPAPTTDVVQLCFGSDDVLKAKTLLRVPPEVSPAAASGPAASGGVSMTTSASGQ